MGVAEIVEYTNLKGSPHTFDNNYLWPPPLLQKGFGTFQLTLCPEPEETATTGMALFVTTFICCGSNPKHFLKETGFTTTAGVPRLFPATSQTVLENDGQGLVVLQFSLLE